MHRAILIAFFLFCACSFFSETTAQVDGREHPDLALIPYSDSVDHVISRDSQSVNESIPLTSMVRRLRNTSIRASIGTADDEGGEVIGEVEDIAVTEDGLYVLDSGFTRIRKYDSDGTPLQTLGRAGQGPGELAQASFLEVTNKGYLAVTDASFLEVHEPIEGQLSEMKRRATPAMVEGLCIIDDLAYVRASDQENADQNIIVYDISNDSIAKINQFGPVYRSDFYMVKFLLSRGSMGCIPDMKRIAVGFTTMPFIYGLTVSGEVIWTSKLRNFQMASITEKADLEGPGLSYNFRGVTDVIVSIQGLPSGYFVVQTQRREMKKPNEMNMKNLHTYVVSATTGEGAYVGSSMSVIFDATDHQLYTADTLPFPQVQILRY